MAVTLTPKDRSAFVQRLIISGVREGLSGNAILNTLRDVGLGYRTQNFYNDYNRYAAVNPNLPRVNLENFNQFLADNNQWKIPTHGGQRYQYVFQVPVTNTDTGEQSFSTFSIVAPHRLIGSVAWAQAQNAVDWGQSNLLPDFQSMEFLGENNFFSQLP